MLSPWIKNLMELLLDVLEKNVKWKIHLYTQVYLIPQSTEMLVTCTQWWRSTTSNLDLSVLPEGALICRLQSDISRV